MRYSGKFCQIKKLSSSIANGRLDDVVELSRATLELQHGRYHPDIHVAIGAFGLLKYLCAVHASSLRINQLYTARISKECSYLVSQQAFFVATSVWVWRLRRAILRS